MTVSVLQAGQHFPDISAAKFGGKEPSPPSKALTLSATSNSTS